MNKNKKTVGVVIPTYNGGSVWKEVVSALQMQRSDFDKILVIDSGSTDETVAIAQNAGFTVEQISATKFNHGGTRNFGLHKIDCDIVVFLTQDAIPANNAISLISSEFEDDRIAVTYGRQLPHDNATPIAEHARLFNYKSEKYVYEFNDKDKHGIKTTFTSNSFAAYKKEVFIDLGGFNDSIIFAEDMHFTARALLAGHKVCYAAEATCKHSHNYSPIQEFRRYFDIGVFHRNESWIREIFGKPIGEGNEFIKSEFVFLWKKMNFIWIPIACVNNFFKMLGYTIGLNYTKIPRKLTTRFTTCKSYWSKAK